MREQTWEFPSPTAACGAAGRVAIGGVASGETVGANEVSGGTFGNLEISEVSGEVEVLCSTFATETICCFFVT